MKFRILTTDGQGNKIGHHRNDNQIFKAGDVLESDRPLDEMFRNKFERVSDNTKVSTPIIVDKTGRVPRIPQPQQQAATDEDNAETSVAAASSHGQDVTSKFPNAVLLNVKVYYNEGSAKYVVTDADEENYIIKKSKSVNNIKRFFEKQIS